MLGKKLELSEEERRERSVRMIGDNNPAKRIDVRLKIADANSNRIVSKETRAKMSISHLGTKRSNKTKKRMSEAQRGVNHPMYGRNHTNESKVKISVATMGRECSKETILKMSNRQQGEGNNNWKGGTKLSNARHRNKRYNRGFVRITDKSPYKDFIYHHIHKSLSYVIPVPRWIHEIVPGNSRNHHSVVCSIMGLKFEFPFLLNTNLEADI